MDADAELVTTLSGQSRVAFDEAVLHIDDLAHGVDDAANELAQQARRGDKVEGAWQVPRDMPDWSVVAGRQILGADRDRR